MFRDGFTETPGFDAKVATMAASLLLRLQKHDPKPLSHPNLCLPLPTPAEWQVIMSCASKALVAYHWYRRHPEEPVYVGAIPGCPLVPVMLPIRTPMLFQCHALLAILYC